VNNFYEQTSLPYIEHLLRSTFPQSGIPQAALVRSVILIITFDVHHCYQSIIHSFHLFKMPPLRGSCEESWLTFLLPTYRSSGALHLAMTLALCWIELQNVAVSDTTKDDSSNLFAT